MDQPNRDDRSKGAADGKAAVSHRRSSVVTAVLLFLAAGLVLDGVAGQRGWLENRRGLQQIEQSQMALEALQRHNAELRNLAKRLRDQDPATVEDLARREFGFIRPGEKLFIVRDAPVPKK
jgi:cell division protein FtsB